MSVSTTSADRGPSLRTFTGRTIWPSDPRPEELHAVDLAHHLSLICRFCGFIPTKHAVGQHCLHTESFITVDIWRGPTLIHEVGEAFSGFGDVAGPIKKIPDVAALIKKREGWVETAASERFGVPLGFASHPIVKAADHLAEHCEDREGRGLPEHPSIVGVPPIVLLDDLTAERRFLERFWELFRTDRDIPDVERRIEQIETIQRAARRGRRIHRAMSRTLRGR